MSELTVTIRTDGAAFHHDCNGMSAGQHLAQLLNEVSDQVCGYEDGPIKAQSIFDINGNRVGQWKWEVDE